MIEILQDENLILNEKYDCDDKSFFELLGIILYIEGTIPLEFSKLRLGREKYFPKLNKKAKIYFDDHIVHDANDHFPRLIKAVKNLPISDLEFEEIFLGINYMHKLRIDFYNSF